MDLSLARPLFALNKRELMARAKSSSSGVSASTATIGFEATGPCSLCFAGPSEGRSSANRILSQTLATLHATLRPKLMSGELLAEDLKQTNRNL
jgi:hypothetical protein